MFPPESHIMVVDDSSAVRTLVKSQLNNLGFQNIVEAEDGQEAIEKMEGFRKTGHEVHLVISDWNMPGMSGIELLTRLKKNPAYKSTPFLMISAQSETDQVINAIVLGVTDYIIKPFDQETLLDKLRLVWKKIHKEG